MIFVTGGTGLLGSHLLYQLSKKFDNILALKQKNSNIDNVLNTFSIYDKNFKELFSKIHWVEGDIRDKYTILEYTKNIETVFHTAAFVSYNKRQKKNIYDINVLGTKNIINACIENKISELIYVSSIASLGENTNNLEISEETHYSENNNSNYSKSKFSAELEAWRGIGEGLNTIIINPSVILGPGYWDKGSSAIFSQIKKGLKYYTNGETGFVNVNDVAKIILLLKEKKAYNQRFIVSAENVKYKEIFNNISDKINSKRPYKYATKNLTKFAYNFENIKSFIFNTNPLITKETAITSHKTLRYSNAKITDYLNYKFTSINETIEFITQIFNNQTIKQK